MTGINMNNAGTISSLLSSMNPSANNRNSLYNINLSDYHSIRSGSYHKLMKAYYELEHEENDKKNPPTTDSVLSQMEDSLKTDGKEDKHKFYSKSGSYSTKQNSGNFVDQSL